MIHQLTHLSLAAVLASSSLAATKVLIDYDDGIPGGDHDLAVRNGGFEDKPGLGTTYADGEDWLSGGGTPSTGVYSGNSRTGSSGGVASFASRPTNNTDHLISAGDVISLSFWVRNPSSATTRPVIWNLGVFDGNSAFTEFETEGSGTVTVNETYQQFTATKTVSEGDFLIGQPLALQFKREDFGDFPVIDDVTLTVSSLDLSYQDWIANFEVGDLTDRNDDPDRDGVPNFSEFALNGDPSASSSQGLTFLKIATVEETAGVLTYTVAVRETASFAPVENRQEAVLAEDSLAYLIEAANDLTDWGAPVVTEVTGPDAAAIQATLTPSAPALGWVYRTFRTDDSAESDPAEFMRLKVTTP